MIRTLLSKYIVLRACTYHITCSCLLPGAISDLNPSLGLGDDGINSVLSVLLSVRERILSELSTISSVTDLTPRTNSLSHMCRCPPRRAHSRPRDTKRLPPASLLRHHWPISAYHPTNTHHNLPTCHSRKCYSGSVHQARLCSSYKPRPRKGHE